MGTRDLILKALLAFKYVQTFDLHFFYVLTVGASFSFSFQSKDLPPESFTIMEDKTKEATAKWRAATPSKDCEASGM